MLRRAAAIADVSCETLVLLDGDDVAHHAIRVTLNGQLVYESMYRGRREVEHETVRTMTTLISVGWREDNGLVFVEVSPQLSA